MLTYWNNNPRVDMLPHSNLLIWFLSNQSLFFPINDVCLAVKQCIPIL
jgi:hypothetical protein